ncbi:MAG: hypothetical protein AB7F43_07075 [Bacteriovoracia bacterium]
MDQKKRPESFITFNFTFSVEAENFRGIGKSLVGWIVAIVLVLIKLVLSLARDGP